MATKWKSRLSIGVCAFLFTFGLSGLIIVSAFGSTYVHRDYFHTTQFRDELNLFAQYLNLFELNHIPIESAKQSITVSQDEIEEYRNRFGNITEQLTFLKDEYKFLIDGAELANNQDAVEIYIAERDKKIEEITQVFKSDDYARAKIITDKEKRVEEYYQGKEQYYLDFLSYKGQLQYYFTSDVSDKVYTNVILADDESITDKMNSHSMSYISSYSIPTEDSDSYYWLRQYNQRANSLIPFKGEVAVSKALPSSSSIAIKYNKYKQEQILVWAYTLASIVSFILCLFVMKKARVMPAAVERGAPYYNKLPIDVRAALILLTGWVTLYLLFSIQDQFLYVLDNPFVSGWSLFIGMVFASIGLAITLAQGRLMAGRIKDWEYIQEEWRKGLLNKAGQSAKAQFIQIKISLKDAFLKTSTGAQLFIVLTIVFGLGLAALMVILNPDFMVAYMVLLAAIGVPLSMVLIRRIGYFNRIVLQANELAIGKLGPDVQVPGKSVLATLAGNMNVLKQGVTTLQNEQAKSERLKTELITNVSHDLRTPLTSIITYTELLKKEDVSNEDRIAYVEIIDQKSQRLKVLIDDLFEVSKMASGNVELNKEKVDLVQLLQQTLAEYDNLIKESNLQFRLPNMEIPVYAFVDGQKLFRVFDNLIGNVLKYSLENSRVYITIQTSGDHALISFKNVSKYEISENRDELFERFKRGDSSRHTEGSGLGLAIAKSIVDLHEGHLTIDVDGDLFKVAISLKMQPS
ncbi:HAMP domain-containing histidine kinase [Cohnella sp. LGH]|uniref:sensor histidine kinase n=1 Tax=Cohnella sp. LGH TaxID=1619153 RepID=UPI001ADC96CA|nr:HAMP domain-containing sensor histidine kinase [Cohnella sp. LGH]QTH42002.1 HAMP domain-containing histidine kinase [Cohnella sp. LGH]